LAVIVVIFIVFVRIGLAGEIEGRGRCVHSGRGGAEELGEDDGATAGARRGFGRGESRKGGLGALARGKDFLSIGSGITARRYAGEVLY
jgi:hypothetical protein